MHAPPIMRPIACAPYHAPYSAHPASVPPRRPRLPSLPPATGAGMFGLLGSLFTFAFALLTRGDDEEPAGVQSRPAWLFFSATLGILIVLALVVPQLLGSSWMWRLRKDGLRGSLHAHCFGLLAPHEPIKFDMEDLATKAEALFDQIDTDRNGHLSSDELKRAVKQAQKDALDAHQNREPEDSLRRTPNTAENETAGLPRSRSVPNARPVGARQQDGCLRFKPPRRALLKHELGPSFSGHAARPA